MKNDELASLGIQAFQCGEHETAIRLLSALIENQPTLWTCRLYLAMAYMYRGEQAKAKQEFSTISEWATDQTIKKKAVDALRAMNARSGMGRLPDPKNSSASASASSL